MLECQLFKAKGQFREQSGSSWGDVIEAEFTQLGSGAVCIYINANESMELLWLAMGCRTLSFKGQTPEGRTVESTDLRFFVGRTAGRQCFLVSFVRLGDPGVDGAWTELAVTNLDLDGDNNVEHRFDCALDQTFVQATLMKAENYDAVLFHSKQSDCQGVTAKIKVVAKGYRGPFLDELFEDLCGTLSVLQGRKINWIQRSSYSENGTLLGTEYSHRITKSYAPGSLCFDYQTRLGRRPSLSVLPIVLQKFVYFRKEYDPRRRIVNFWVDARLQEDFLEARTLKYVVVLEALCSLVQIARPGPTASRREKRPRSFFDKLSKTLGDLGIENEGGEKRIREVVEMRNRIVHELRYLSPADFAKEKRSVKTNSEQHFFVACFVDEVLMRLFGLIETLPSNQNHEPVPTLDPTSL